MVSRVGENSDQQWNRLYYDEWVAREGLDLVRGYMVDNVYTMPLKYWPRTGGYAAHIQLDGTGELDAAYVCEIPAGRELNPQRHLYEELIYVLSGRGSTSVWYPGQRKNSFEWGAGSLFAVPLNAWYQHFNGSGSEPARYVAVTTAPIMMNLIRNDDFVFDNDAVFPERYGGAEEYFAGEVDYETHHRYDKPMRVACSNFFADVNGIPDERLNKGVRGIGTRSISFDLADGTLASHILEVPGGTFTKLHRHGPGAHVLWLKGEGYTLMWPDGGEKVKADWGPGTMVVPPSWWWHQHCVAGQTPAQHLALRFGSRHSVDRLGEGTLKSVRAGGSQMNYEDFPAELRAELEGIFRDECARHGTPVQMAQMLDY
jgi:uncharacterized RmlC-like cupin family protein